MAKLAPCHMNRLLPSFHNCWLCQLSLGATALACFNLLAWWTTYLFQKWNNNKISKYRTNEQYWKLNGPITKDIGNRIQSNHQEVPRMRPATKYKKGLIKLLGIFEPLNDKIARRVRNLFAFSNFCDHISIPNLYFYIL